jgi:hypothetical protein
MEERDLGETNQNSDLSVTSSTEYIRDKSGLSPLKSRENQGFFVVGEASGTAVLAKYPGR